MRNLYPDDDAVNLIKEISERDYNEKEREYPIEHTQKVILYSDILAREEKLDEEEKKLLLTAAALHDGGIKTININKDKNFMSQNLPIIQTAIEYNKFLEYPVGKINKKEIRKIGSKYQLQFKDLKTTEKISMLLKDATLLGKKYCRERIDYLHSETAKREEIIDFANMINNDVSEELDKIKEQGGKNISVEKVLQIFMKEKGKDYKGNEVYINRFFNMNGVEFDDNELKRVNDAVYGIFKSEIEKDDGKER